MKNSFKYLLTATALVVSLTDAIATADLTLFIDTNNETWELAGSDSGEMGISGTSSVVEWFTATFEIDPYQAISGTSPAFEVDGFSQVNDNDNFAILQTIFQGPVFSVKVSAFTSFQTSNTTTLTALGGRSTYSFLSPASKTWFEGLIGSEVQEFAGSSFNPISVRAVPEPTGFWLIALTGLAFARRYRVSRR